MLAAPVVGLKSFVLPPRVTVRPFAKISYLTSVELVMSGGGDLNHSADMTEIA